MNWILDGWVKCPDCGEYGDAASVFGDCTPESQLPHTDPRSRIDALETGLEGKCDRCGCIIVVKLEAKDA